MTSVEDTVIAHMIETSELFGHDLDYRTQFCRRCGASLEWLVENDVPDCYQGRNIVGLNHHRSLKQFTAFFSSSQR